MDFFTNYEPDGFYLVQHKKGQGAIKTTVLIPHEINKDERVVTRWNEFNPHPRASRSNEYASPPPFTVKTIIAAEKFDNLHACTQNFVEATKLQADPKTNIYQIKGSADYNLSEGGTHSSINGCWLHHPAPKSADIKAVLDYLNDFIKVERLVLLQTKQYAHSKTPRPERVTSIDIQAVTGNFIVNTINGSQVVIYNGLKELLSRLFVSDQKI